ncbi:hypothetical protein EDD16DRAFT_1720405 [Pisolithus croceorrhizus]|nr:hypothetical protein EDD16DRAFT_1720405 [Pisolithus croceorrhizus]
MGIPDSFASPFVGGFVSAMLYGVATLQTYMYYLHGYEDSLAIKLLVAAIWILDTLHILFSEYFVFMTGNATNYGLVCHALYFYMITNYGVLTSLEYIVWSLPVCIPNLPPDAEDFPALGTPLISAVQWLVNHKISIFTQMTFYGVTPAVAIIALAETLITISLCILLYDRRSGSALSRTKRLLNTLIIYAVNRCLLILLVAITALVMAVEGQVTWFLGLSFVIGRLYANSFLASLNSREHLRSKGSGTLPDPRIGVAHFTNPPKVLGDIENFKDGARQVDVPEEDVIDITVYPASDKTTKLCSEGKV